MSAIKHKTDNNKLDVELKLSRVFFFSPACCLYLAVSLLQELSSMFTNQTFAEKAFSVPS